MDWSEGETKTSISIPVDYRLTVIFYDEFNSDELVELPFASLPIEGVKSIHL